ncbi:hypothetical protein DOE52_10770 [Porphyromonas gingivalis]|nr:hypothetical protein CLI78_10660 [Porphyromonas gingivalis]RRG12746.1 hypothetical protein DOE52_10770 [Porphyromonas gingivalis]
MLFYRTAKVVRFPHMRKYFFVYTPINFRIYGNIFSYIRKFPSLYTQRGYTPFVIDRVPMYLGLSDYPILQIPPEYCHLETFEK